MIASVLFIISLFSVFIKYVLSLNFRVVSDALVRSVRLLLSQGREICFFYVSMPRMSALIFLGAQRAAAAAHLMAGFHPLFSPAVHGCILPGVKGKLEMGPSFVLA